MKHPVSTLRLLRPLSQVVWPLMYIWRVFGDRSNGFCMADQHYGIQEDKALGIDRCPVSASAEPCVPSLELADGVARSDRFVWRLRLGGGVGTNRVCYKRPTHPKNQMCMG